MKALSPLNPILDFQALDAAEMLNVVCHHGEARNFSGTANEEVIILYGGALSLESELLLAESINSFGKGNNFHFADEIVNNVEILFLILALVCTKTQFHHRHISNIALLRSDLEARMSSIISSAVLSSSQRPAKLFVHPFSLDDSDTELATELLNSVMSSSFTLLLRSFNSDQYFALTDETGDNVIGSMMMLFCYLPAKIRIKSEPTKKN